MMHLVINRLVKKYDNVVILDVPYLDIPSNSFFGIIGANGSGKSTLVSSIASLIDIEQGDISYNGDKFHESLRKDISIVFQSPLMLRGSVFYNISYPLRIRGIFKDAIKQMVDNIAQELEIVDLLHKDVSALSGGERQKVALARSIIFSPKLLLLDEATANIDRQSAKVIENSICKLHKRGTTIIMVTHSLSQASKMCTDVIFMSDGKIIEKGKPQDVIFNPRDAKTIEFISDSTI